MEGGALASAAVDSSSEVPPRVGNLDVHGAGFVEGANEGVGGVNGGRSGSGTSENGHRGPPPGDDASPPDPHPFSCDLVSNARLHLLFLRALHASGASLGRPSPESLRRYAELWLPLVARYHDELLVSENSKEQEEEVGGRDAGADDSDVDLLVDDSGLVPPPDVAWLWHCHRLAPLRYERHVRERFGGRRVGSAGANTNGMWLSSSGGGDRGRSVGFMEADPPFAVQEGGDADDGRREGGGGGAACNEDGILAEVNARILWSRLYPDEPFFLPRHPTTNRGDEERSRVLPNAAQLQPGGVTNQAPTGNDGPLLSGFDLLSSAERQSTFLWQVSGPRFVDPTTQHGCGGSNFLDDAVANYRRFLRLRSLDPDQILVPTYQIDLMWHTHILSSISDYHADCRAVMGRTLNHDDSLNDRSEGSKLDVSYRATRELWRREYGEEYAVPGGMYRGEPPAEYRRPGWAVGDIGRAAALPPTGPHPHLVGRVGASSTGKDPSSLQKVEPTATATAATAPGGDGSIPLATVVEWTDPNSPFPAPGSTDPPFLPANPRSTTRGVNANERRDTYVFGVGSLGAGYYHNTTKDCYNILITRIDKRVQAKRSELSCVKTFVCLCPCLGMGFRSDELKEEIVALEEAMALARARSEAEVPLGTVGLDAIPTTGDDGGANDGPSSAEDEAARMRRDRIRNEHTYYAADGTWLFPLVLWEAGGGCGACTPGAGCGGGGCGAGACGGGGGGDGGGGGCGGGGCGGGGCGGGCGG